MDHIRWLVLGALWLCIAAQPVLPAPPLPLLTQDELWHCTRVVDGDTIVAQRMGVTIKVRLIGVNTPETVDPFTSVQPYGPEASAFTKSLIADKDVYLVPDLDTAKQDKYGRWLYFVYRASDSYDVDWELVRLGYGRALTRYKFTLRPYYRAAEKRAKCEHLGLWGLPAELNP